MPTLAEAQATAAAAASAADDARRVANYAIATAQQCFDDALRTANEREAVTASQRNQASPIIKACPKVPPSPSKGQQSYVQISSRWVWTWRTGWVYQHGGWA
jgi:hypothetical protein